MAGSEIILRILSALLILSGGTFMVMTTYRYHKLVHNIRESTYNHYPIKHVQQNISLILLYIFLAGYLIGFIDVLFGQIKPIFLFISIIFFLGGFFIFFAVSNLQEMEGMLREKIMELMKTFVNSIELKDSYTKGHSHHVYAVVEVFYNYMDDSYKKQLNYPKLMDAAMLHDIGKICIKDDVLNKEGELTTEEWEMIKKHPMEAKKLLDDTCFKEISDWVLYHHERVDGKGYYSLRAEEIPLESKIISIADTYCALSTNRSYRRRMQHATTLKIMQNSAGTQFDEELLECFFRIPPRELIKLVW